MSEPPVLLERSGAVCRVTLNRPQQLNSFTVEMHEALRAALDEIERAQDARVLVLTGAGRAFCSGQDLNERAGMLRSGSVDLGASLEQWYAPLVLRLRRLPIPVIAAVNGVAAGAGSSLALACDLVIAARSAGFIQSFVKVGLAPDCGGTWLLPRLVGRARASALALLGERISAEDAVRLGLIWRCVPDDELNATVTALAAQLSDASPSAIACIKQLLDASFANRLEQQLRLEAEAQRELGTTPNYREEVLAFAEKRTPSKG